jgi:hypothetical protein
MNQKDKDWYLYRCYLARIAIKAEYDSIILDGKHHPMRSYVYPGAAEKSDRALELVKLRTEAFKLYYDLREIEVTE